MNQTDLGFKFSYQASVTLTATAPIGSPDLRLGSIRVAH